MIGCKFFWDLKLCECDSFPVLQYIWFRAGPTCWNSHHFDGLVIQFIRCLDEYYYHIMQYTEFNISVSFKLNIYCTALYFLLSLINTILTLCNVFIYIFPISYCTFLMLLDIDFVKILTFNLVKIEALNTINIQDLSFLQIQLKKLTYSAVSSLE